MVENHRYQIQTLEEVGVEDVVGSGGGDDLRESVDAGVWKSVPVVGAHQRIAVARPVEAVLVHPVVRAAEEVRVVDVHRLTGARRRRRRRR